MTEQDKFTPGPWSLYLGEDRDVISVLKRVVGNGGGLTGKSICRMATPNLRAIHKNAILTQDEVNANGRLIAAAPALLEALEIAVAHEGDTRHPPWWIEQARAAIALARGV